MSAGAGAQTPPHTPTLDQQFQQFHTLRVKLLRAEHDSGDSSATIPGRVRMVPHLADRELQDPARFIGCARLTAAFIAAEDGEQRRKVLARIRFETHRWTRAMPITWQQERRIAGFWRGAHLSSTSTTAGLKAPGRPAADLDAQAGALRARVEQEAGTSWDAISEAERRDLVIRLAAKQEASAAARLLGCNRRTISRLRKAAER